MTTPNYEDTITHPLTTDALVEQRVAALVGRANRRQLWFLFLDENQVQLPLLMPVSDIPERPDASMSHLASLIENAMEACGARSVIVVIERYADATFSASDKAWARSLSETFERRKTRLRCILLSHRRGVRWFAQDDYGFSA